MTSQQTTRQRAAVTIVPIREVFGSVHEPALDEMLSDPIVIAMMNADGVDRRTLRSMLSEIACALRARATAGADDWTPPFRNAQGGSHSAICL